jgi:signal transduction histidine kinase
MLFYVGFVIFLLANLFAMNFSKKMTAINIDILQSSFSALATPNSQGMYRLEPAKNKTAIEEIDSIVDKHNALVERFNKLIESSAEQVRINSFAEVAAQVAHDVRSPLAALNMFISRTDVLPEEQRLVLRRAVNRINDIANNLINMNRRIIKAQKNQDLSETTIEESETLLVSSLVDSLVSEKRLQFRDDLEIEIITDLTTDSYGLFI